MKHTKYLLLLSLCLALTACGQKLAENPPETDLSKPPAVSEPAPNISEPDVSDPDRSGSVLLAPLTAEDLAAAHQAALDYYQGTIFTVDTLTEIEPRQGEVAFQVSCSKGGVKVDPDRTIWLERQDGVWTVISEGY